MIAKATLCELSAVEERPCITVYGSISDKYSNGSHNGLDTSLLNNIKSLVSEEQLHELEGFLNALSLENHLSNSRRWGFAIFATQGRLQYFHCPDIQNSLISIANAFDVKHLVPGMYVADHFHVIALYNDRIQLYRFDERVRTHGDECVQELTTGHRNGFSKLSKCDTPIMNREQIESMYRSFDALLYHSLRNDNCPIMLAGTVSEQALYRSITHLEQLHKAALPPVHDLDATRQLAEDTILECYREGLVQANREFYLAKSLNLISNDIEEILYLESAGRVKTLFVCNNAQLYGKYTEGAQVVERLEEQQPGHLDLISVAVRRGLLFNAEVYVLPPEEMPSPVIAAILKG